MNKSVDAFRTISEVELEIPKHVLRFWEVKFPQIKPMKRGGGRRYYRPEDVVLLRGIRNLLHAEGYTIKGVQKILRGQGIEEVKQFAEPRRETTGKGKPAAGVPDTMGRVRKLARGRTSESRPSEFEQRHFADLIDGAIRELEACRIRLGQASTDRGVPGSVTSPEGPTQKGMRNR
ncbi:MAG: MerR family transcriptional regulator [Hyphomicrobiaceae bacterium]|nr:MerR family transcriptional regulator [Hyphomicrobiaceae bacterium]